MSLYRKLKKNKGSGKALVATARKLTKVIWTLLSNDEEYNSSKMTALVDNEIIDIAEAA